MSFVRSLRTNTSGALRGSFALLAIAACGPSSSNTPSSVGMSPTEFATQYCSLVKPCCDGAGLSPATGCVNAIASFVPATFDGNAAQGCLDAIRASSSTPAFCNKGAALADHNACKFLSTARGSVAVGGSCNNATTNTECATSSEGQVGCVFGKGGSTCTIQLRGDEGAAPCVNDSGADGSIPPGSGSLDGEVAPTKGYYCDRSKGLHCLVSNHTCVKASPVGQACQYNDYECATGAYCDTTAKQCKATVAIGAPCPDYRSCGVDAYCDSTAQPPRCTKLGADGDACKGGVQCASGFCNVAKVCAAGFSGSTGALICAK